MVVAELVGVVTSMDHVVFRGFQNWTLPHSDSIQASNPTTPGNIYTPSPLPLFRTPELKPPDPILTKPVGIVPTDPARPGSALNQTEDLAGGDSGVNLSRVKPRDD